MQKLASAAIPRRDGAQGLGRALDALLGPCTQQMLVIQPVGVGKRALEASDATLLLG